MKISHFKVGEQGLNRFFGPLEAKIMDVLWNYESLSIKDVQVKLGEDKAINFNTVMTVMNRLVDKGVLLKSLQGRTSIYTPAQSREEFMTTQSKELTLELMDQFGSIAVTHMLDAVEEADPELIRRLEQKIKQWKKDLE
ncbi:BlaI/MecI/CopY family transcriptional regulator [Neobacillus mesonae]|nr:BlaI/MecI/CopY family transcriptional regulator [Neobacillus mesonae]